MNVYKKPLSACIFYTISWEKLTNRLVLRGSYNTLYMQIHSFYIKPSITLLKEKLFLTFTAKIFKSRGP